VRWRFKKGFVLPEVLLAAAIAAFAICGLLLMYIASTDLIRTSKNASIATSAALGLMEEIRDTPFPQIVTDYELLTFSVNNIPRSLGIVYVDDTDPEFLLVTISVCWIQGNRTIGEDLNLNGRLDAGEDTNGNGIIDSTVELVTQVANR
jgi:type II secretory pathway pseudopilin PulG